MSYIILHREHKIYHVVQSGRSSSPKVMSIISWLVYFSRVFEPLCLNLLKLDYLIYEHSRSGIWTTSPVWRRREVIICQTLWARINCRADQLRRESSDGVAFLFCFTGLCKLRRDSLPDCDVQELLSLNILPRRIVMRIFRIYSVGDLRERQPLPGGKGAGSGASKEYANRHMFPLLVGRFWQL